MMIKPSIGSRFRSVLSGDTVKVKSVMGDLIVIRDENGNSTHVHIRDFNAEYRLVQQQQAVNL